ncbi:hypothetical protein NPIL_267261 [Nephila pilipes]|uniref:Uncharacterized protein n=1 Tax=Nephila pilipes TaxID=299642 RepID=A0A8X6MPW5_NEPPI|nr:hypothetical protein NPIL_267261 [Nephila pilipes]
MVIKDVAGMTKMSLKKAITGSDDNEEDYIGELIAVAKVGQNLRKRSSILPASLTCCLKEICGLLHRQPRSSLSFKEMKRGPVYDVCYRKGVSNSTPPAGYFPVQYRNKYCGGTACETSVLRSSRSH